MLCAFSSVATFFSPVSLLAFPNAPAAVETFAVSLFICGNSSHIDAGRRSVAVKILVNCD